MSEWLNLLRLAERNGIRLNEGFRARGAQPMTESNTPSDIGPNAPKGRANGIKTHGHGETRIMIARETPRERMLRIIQTGRKKKK